MPNRIDLSTCEESIIHVEFPHARELFSNSTFLVQNLVERIQEACTRMSTREKKELFSSGVTCRFLKPGAEKWQNGKLKLTIEFEPEVPEISANVMPESDKSSLDAIRHSIEAS